MAFTLFSSGAAAVEPIVFHGYARDAASGNYLYTERHEQVIRNGRWQSSRVIYYDTEGRELGRKASDFTQHTYVPVYSLRLSSGYEEGISAVGSGSVAMFRRAPDDDARETVSERLHDRHAADAGFHSLIYDHLDEILDGETQHFRFSVPGRMSTYRFRVHKSAEIELDGDPAVLLIMEPSTLLRLGTRPIELIYSPEDGRLLEYRGISTLRDPATGEPWPRVRVRYGGAVPDEARSSLPERAAD